MSFGGTTHEARTQQLESRIMLTVDYVQLAESLDAEFVVLQDRLTAALNGLQTGATSHVPIVGDQLGRAANIVSSFRTEMREALESFGTTTPTTSQLQSVLAEHLGSFLGPAGPAGVHVSDTGDTTTIEMLLQGSAVLDNVDISFDTGLPSLPIRFTSNGSLELSVGYALEVAFTIHETTGVVGLINGTRNLAGVTAPDSSHPLVDNNSDLALFVSAGPSSDFNAKAVFGFVEGFATLLPGEPNGLYATVLVSDLLGTPSIRIDGSADANLKLAGSFAGTSDDFPGISTDFHFHWGLSSADPSFGAPTVAFDNVSLTFGTFLSNVLRPSLKPIKDALDPLSPVLTLLSQKVPGISDLSEAGGAGPITVLDLAVLGSNLTGNGPLGELAGKITNLLAKIDSIQLGTNISLPLGGFDLNSTTNGDLRKAVIAGDFKDLSLSSISPLSAANLNNLAQSASQSLSTMIADLGISEDLKDELRGLNALKTQNGFQIGFPILNNPAGVVFNMLLGRDADLFFFQADAKAELQGTRATGLHFFGQPINLFGRMDIDTHLRFGYDTFGLRQLIANLAAGDASQIVSDITDGFYVNSDSYFKMAGAMGAEWGASVLNVFPVSISGGFFTQNSGLDPVHVYIEDPNADGKLRFDEFHVGLDNKPAAFKLTGELAAELNVEVGFPDPDLTDILPAPPNKKLSVAREVLIRFATLTPSRLASEPDANGEVTLLLGTNAHQRAAGQNQDDGDEKFVIEHLQTNSNGSEDIKVRAFGINQIVRNVRKIKATDQVGTLNILVQPGVTSDVDFDGGQGAAFLTYQGSGLADLTGGVLASELTGGSGPSILTGRAGNDTIVLGSDVNTVDAGGGNNTVIAKAPIRKSSVISGGTGGHNFLKVIASPTTTAITATPVGNTINLGIQNGVSLNFVTLNFSNFDDVFINASFNSTNFTLGDLAAAGVSMLTLDVQSRYPTSRSIDLETRVGNAASIIGIRDYVYPVPNPAQPSVQIDQHGAQIVNTTTGLTTRLLGFHSDDTLTLRHHGGSITVDALQLDGGHFVFNNSSRVGNVSAVIQITLPGRDNGNAEIFDRFRDVQMVYSNYSSFRVTGSRIGDQLNVDVSAPTAGATTIDIDAMSIHGQLNLRMLGTQAATNHLTLRRSGLEAAVSIFGQNTTTDLLLGVGQLSAIRHDVFASNVKLTVDNDESTLASILTLDGTSFGTWNIPTLSGVTPKLTFSSLRSEMTVYAGAGDRFQLDVTPSSISSMIIYNQSMTVQDSVYTSNWSVPLRLLGNFSFYAGQRLRRDGTIERVKRLINVNAKVDIGFRGIGLSEVVLDADLDVPGAKYLVNAPVVLDARVIAMGLPPSLQIVNQTVGLDVNIAGYRDADRVYAYLTGADVDANLRSTGAGQIHFDGRARLAGIHPTAPNDITILARAGSTTMTPLGQYNSLLDMYNDVYVLGAIPQDKLDVTQPTEFRMASTLTGTNQIRFDYSLSGQSGFTVTSPTARYTVHSTIAQVPLNPSDLATSKFKETPITPITSFVDREIMYQDLTRSPLEAQIHEIRGNYIPWSFFVNGAVVTIPVEVIVRLQIYQPNPNPIATDNHANFDASQLRGTFGFHVSDPDYTFAELLADGLLRGGAPPATNFGQSYVTISKTNPELTTTITGTTQTNAFHYDRLVRFTSGGTVSRWAGMQVAVGTGDLGTLQGNLVVDQAWLKEIDNRNAALANITQLTAAGVSWDAGDGGRTSLILSNLQGKLTVTGSPLDRFAVEGTPNSAYRTILRNFSTAATPMGVYVMGKNVMPLEVSGNFDLAVGRRLNLDGTVTDVGTILGAVDDTKNYVYTGGQNFAGGNFPGVWQDFELRPTTNAITGPIVWSSSGYLTSLVGTAQPKPSLPIYYNYSGPGQGTFVFDASNDTVTDRVLGDMIVQTGGGSLNGISSNSNYVGTANFRFYGSEVIYGSNTNVYWYGAKLRTNTNAFDVMAPTLFNNVLNGAVYYFANPSNVGQNPIEQILVGNTLGPVYIEGSGRNSRVEINPVFSLPTSLAMGIADTSINNQSFAFGSHPGWGAGHTGGYSLIDTIRANVSVSGAALRVIGDVPRAVGSPPITSRPNVTIGGSSITGIGTGTINYSNLVDSVNVSQFTFNSQLDLNPLNFPGLNVQLPAHFPVNATIENTPGGATTHVTTLLSSANNTFTNGALDVRATTGKLILGDMYGVAPTFGDKFNWPGLAGNIVTSWSDGISVSQINIGNNGSLAGIQGAILLKGDSHTTTTTVTNIDGRNDAARPNVIFTRPAYSSNPFPTPSVPYQQVDGLAAAPIYFGSFLDRPRPLDIRGSAASTYDVVSAPLKMRLFAGENSDVTARFPSLSVIGAGTVHARLDSSYFLSSLPGPPELSVEQDPARPHVVDLQFDQSGLAEQGATLRLESAGNGSLRVARSFVQSPDGWRVIFNGADVRPTLNYGRISVTDTGAAGTVLSSKAFSINILATSYPMQILPVGLGTSNTGVTLGNPESVTGLNPGSMQGILGDIEISAPNVTLDNRNDASRRVTHFSTDVDGSTLITGLSPGRIRKLTPGGVNAYGGIGGTDFYIDSYLNGASLSSFSLEGRSPSDVLIGPDLSNVWRVLDQNVVFLNSNVVVRAVPSLRGGSDHDAFSIGQGFNTTGSLTGNLDGGPGNDSLYYLSGTLSGVIDLPNNKAPRIAGQTLNIEQTGTFFALTVSNQAAVRARVLVPITPITINAFGGFGQKRYSATELPTGVSINPVTGVIIGTPTVENYSAFVTITVADDSGSRAIGFTWTTAPGLEITAVPNQTNRILSSVNLTISTVNIYGTTLTYSATGLPAGLSINSQTGAITGTIADGAQTSPPYQVTINATDGTHSTSVALTWTTLPGLEITAVPGQTTQVQAPVSLTIQTVNVYGTTLTYSATGLPNGLSINSQTGAISGTIVDGAQLASPYRTVITATDGARSATTEFSWNVIRTPFILNPGTQTSPEGLPVNLAIQVLNATGTITYSATGLPVGVIIDTNTGVISGAFGQSSTRRATYNITVRANTSQGQVSATFSWKTIPGVTLTGITDRFDSVAGNIFQAIYATAHEFGNVVTTTVTGLPPGLTHSGFFVTGIIDLYGEVGGPYHPVVTVTNETYNYTYQTTFEWTVVPSVVLVTPAAQFSDPGDVVDLQVNLLRDLGNTILWTAENLPLGLEINPQTGHITGAVQSLPYGETYRYVSVTATEAGGDFTSHTVSFDWNVNSDPFILLSTATIAENSPNGTVLGTLSLADLELTGTFSIYDNHEGLFQLSENGTQVIVNDRTWLDFEENPIEYLYVQVFLEAIERYVSRTIEITVTDVNEAPTEVTLSNVVDTLQEDASTTAATRLADIEVTDADGGNNLLTVGGPDASFFGIVNSQLYLKSGVRLNFANKPTYAITINVDDSTVGGSPDVLVSYTLNLTSTAPTVVTTPTPTQDMTPTITWSVIPGAARYDVWITNLSTNTVMPTQTVIGTSYTPTSDLGIGRFRVWVRSQNAANVKSRWSASFAFVIKTAVTVNPLELRQITARPDISWRPLSGATRYEIWVSSSTVSGFVYRNDTLTGTSWRPESDLAAGRYRAWVRGFAADGTPGTWSEELTQMVVVPAPTLITTPTPTQDMTPTITWPAVPGAVNYEVWITNLSTNTALPAQIVTSPSYTPTADLGIGRFRVWVRLGGPASFKSPWSAPHNFTINTAVTLDPIVRRQNTPKPQISWQPLPGATRYEVYIKSPSISGFLLREPATGTTWTPSSDLAIGRYQAWVRGYSADGTPAAWSREISMIADIIVVPAPALISPLHATFDRTPAFTWTSVTGAAHYILRVRNSNTGVVVMEQTVAATSLTFGLPFSDGSYNWEVRSVGSLGHQSAFSPSNRLYVGGRPVIFGPVGNTNLTEPTFLWSAVQDASLYELRVDRTDTVQNRLIVRSDLTTTSFKSPVSLAVGTYRFWVRAISVNGEFSPWSLVSNFAVVAIEEQGSRPLSEVTDILIPTVLSTKTGELPRTVAEDPAIPGPAGRSAELMTVIADKTLIDEVMSSWG